MPERAMEDLVLADPDPAVAAGIARQHGIGGIAVPAFDIESIPDRVAWARAVVEQTSELAGAAR